MVNHSRRRLTSGHIGHQTRLIWILGQNGRLHEVREERFLFLVSLPKDEWEKIVATLISLVLSKEDVLPLGGRRHMLESLKDICDAFFAKKAENRKRGPGPCKQNTIQAPMHLSKVDIRPKRES
ncbi:hypothetical protein HAX54_052995 [Datura stramonium]|uniref:Uncharacterized protein n=1 Tax=Datura stramonium TaxID=4076 RepID=A0ABS8T1Z6_DATST|nr:hypothetical protein [Datura stramonium]